MSESIPEATVLYGCKKIIHRAIPDLPIVNDKSTLRSFLWECDATTHPEPSQSVCSPESDPYEYLLLPNNLNGNVIPTGSGVQVGGESSIKYLVFKGHFHPHGSDHLTAMADSDLSFNLTFASGVGDGDLLTAGMIRLRALDVILLPGRKTQVNVTCTIMNATDVRILRIFSHTHELGIRVFVSVSRKTGPGTVQEHVILESDRDTRRNTWSKEFEGDFYLRTGDQITVGCLFNNTRLVDVGVG